MLWKLLFYYFSTTFFTLLHILGRLLSACVITCCLSKSGANFMQFSQHKLSERCSINLACALTDGYESVPLCLLGFSLETYLPLPRKWWVSLCLWWQDEDMGPEPRPKQIPLQQVQGCDNIRLSDWQVIFMNVDSRGVVSSSYCQSQCCKIKTSEYGFTLAYTVLCAWRVKMLPC